MVEAEVVERLAGKAGTGIDGAGGYGYEAAAVPRYAPWSFWVAGPDSNWRVERTNWIESETIGQHNSGLEESDRLPSGILHLTFICRQADCLLITPTRSISSH